MPGAGSPLLLNFIRWRLRFLDPHNVSCFVPAVWFLDFWKMCFVLRGGPGSVVGIVTGQGWTLRESNPGGGEVFRTCPDRPWRPRSLLYNGYGVFPGGKERPGRKADSSPLLVPWSRKGRAIPLLPLWAVQPVQSLSACTRAHFTFTFRASYYWNLPFLFKNSCD